MKAWFDEATGDAVVEFGTAMRVAHGNYGSVVYFRAADKAHQDAEFWHTIGNMDAYRHCAKREQELRLAARVFEMRENDPTGKPFVLHENDLTPT